MSENTEDATTVGFQRVKDMSEPTPLQHHCGHKIRLKKICPIHGEVADLGDVYGPDEVSRLKADNERLCDLESRIKAIKPGSIEEYFATEERCALAEATVAAREATIAGMEKLLADFRRDMAVIPELPPGAAEYVNRNARAAVRLSERLQEVSDAGSSLLRERDELRATIAALRLALERFHVHRGDRGEVDCYGPGFCVAADALASDAGSSLLAERDALKAKVAELEGMVLYNGLDAQEQCGRAEAEKKRADALLARLRSAEAVCEFVDENAPDGHTSECRSVDPIHYAMGCDCWRGQMRELVAAWRKTL